ncbi:MAG: 50S ribosomal protein L6 [Treponemataceae bacterium]|nr:50S ribosomal protein L6 [Treponemataceae bacterium]
MSRIGKLPVAVPAGVKVTVNGTCVLVEGPKGKLTQDCSELVTVEVKDNEVVVSPKANANKGEAKAANAAQGLYRQLINNMVIGVSAGYTKVLMINGVGYRAEVQGKMIVMNLGYSSDFVAVIPEGLTVTVEGQNKMTIAGIDKQLVGEFAAEIRKLRKPEPYKGKGIKYETETIRRKVGKSGVK